MNGTDLIDAGAEFWRGRAEMAGLDPECPAYADNFDRLAQSLGKLEDRMMATPADTPAGIAVKLRIVLDKATSYLPHERNDQGDISDHPLGIAILSALHDSERLGGAS